MKKIFLLILFLFFLTACSQNVTDKEFLTGGTWIAAAGYEDGEASGEPNCHPFEDGLTFMDEDTVHNTTYDKDFEYRLFEDDGESNIYFADPKPGYGYRVKKLSEDEIVLEGVDGSSFEKHSCYLERK